MLKPFAERILIAGAHIPILPSRPASIPKILALLQIASLQALRNPPTMRQILRDGQRLSRVMSVTAFLRLPTGPLFRLREAIESARRRHA